MPGHSCEPSSTRSFELYWRLNVTNSSFPGAFATSDELGSQTGAYVHIRARDIVCLGITSNSREVEV